MKRGFITLFTGLVLSLAAVPAEPALAAVRQGAPSADRVADDELKQRFLVAMSRSREPQRTTMLERQRLSALQIIEEQTGLNLGVARTIEDAMARDPNLKMGKVTTNRRGIGKKLPEALQLTFETAGKKIGSELKMNSQTVDISKAKPTAGMQVAGFFLLAGALIDECRVDEPQANRKFLNHMTAQPWPDAQAKMLLVYLVSGMYQNGCISKAEYEAVYKPLLPAIRRRATEPEATPGTMAGTLFFLLAVDGLNGVSDELLDRFARAQSADGTWADELQKSSASLFSALGAAVLSHMMKDRGIKVQREEILSAYANPPVLAGQESKRSTP